MTRAQIIAEKLAAMGLRVATSRERGWTVRLKVGETMVTVWATDGRAT